MNKLRFKEVRAAQRVAQFDNVVKTENGSVRKALRKEPPYGHTTHCADKGDKVEVFVYPGGGK